MKQDQRKQELNDFNEKTKNKQDLHKELMEMDQNIKQKQGVSGSHVDLGEDEMVELSEVDKRLLMYRNMRNKLLQELANNKQNADKAKMDELNRKIAALEKAQREKEEKELERQRQEQMQENRKMAENKKILDSIKSYNIEDI
jgi:hypothetical protein